MSNQRDDENQDAVVNQQGREDHQIAEDQAGSDDIPDFQALNRLNKDLRKSSRELGRSRVQQLVQLYYRAQDIRTMSAHHRRTQGQKPNQLIDWLESNWKFFESDIKRSMAEFVDEYRVGQWLTSIVGIGPVLAAGWISGLDLTEAETVGHWWSLCGYNPERKWLGREKARVMVNEVMTAVEGDLSSAVQAVATRTHIRPSSILRQATRGKDGVEVPLTQATLTAAVSRRPWSHKLKVLGFKTGDCFVKFCHHPKQYYGTVYLNRKEYETRKNANGDYAAQAALQLQQFNYGKATEAYKWYTQGKLPPAHIQSRCVRYTVKMFLSHLHHVMFLDVRGTNPPAPLALSFPGHSHWVPIPNFDLDDPWTAYPGKSLADIGE